jgi:hypothetical protein
MFSLADLIVGRKIPGRTPASSRKKVRIGEFAAICGAGKAHSPFTDRREGTLTEARFYSFF